MCKFESRQMSLVLWVLCHVQFVIGLFTPNPWNSTCYTVYWTWTVIQTHNYVTSSPGFDSWRSSRLFIEDFHCFSSSSTHKNKTDYDHFTPHSSKSYGHLAIHNNEPDNKLQSPRSRALLDKLILEKSIQDVYGADINRHCPGNDIILASYWTRTGEVPLCAVTPCYCNITIISLDVKRIEVHGLLKLFIAYRYEIEN
jgi:hypothetical protein